MNEYVIITDSTTDLGPDILKDMDVRVLPLKYTIEGKTYDDNTDVIVMDTHEFYDKLRAGSMSKTTQLNADEFKAAFTEYLEAGKDILYIGFSTGLSGTFQSACIARDDIMESYPERKLICVDSLAASMGEGLLVYEADKLRKEGKSIEEVAQWLKDNVDHMAHWFTVDDLNFLKRGGRVSAATAVVGTVLGIKPILHVDDEGHLINVGKVRGRKASLDALVNKIGETASIDPAKQTIFISHGDCIEDAKYVAKQIMLKYKTKDIKIHYVGPVIGGHAGPGVVALFFFANKK